MGSIEGRKNITGFLEECWILRSFKTWPTPMRSSGKQYKKQK